jgi:hypothetical protein
VWWDGALNDATLHLHFVEVILRGTCTWFSQLIIFQDNVTLLQQVLVLVVRYFTFSLLHPSHMISAGTPTRRGNPTKMMFVNFKIDLCRCKFLWQVEWPEYLYENLSKVSIRLL